LQIVHVYDNLKIGHWANCILNGEVLEEYLDDYPYCSYLMLRFTTKSENLLVVCGIGDNKLLIITAYFPSLDKWENNFKERKEQ
jgi:hypothetical protein